MTKANSNLHRAVALLAALCLLASMALPVYAAETETDFSVSNTETIPGDDNTGNWVGYFCVECGNDSKRRRHDKRGQQNRA